MEKQCILNTDKVFIAHISSATDSLRQSVYVWRSVTKPHKILSPMHQRLHSSIHEYVNSVTGVKVMSAGGGWHANGRSSVRYDLTRTGDVPQPAGRVRSDGGTPSVQLTDHLPAYELTTTAPRARCLFARKTSFAFMCKPFDSRPMLFMYSHLSRLDSAFA